MRIKEVLIISLLMATMIVISGADQCPQGTGTSSSQGLFGGISGGKTEAVKYGVDFILNPGLDKLTAGKTVKLGESDYADILLENFDSEQKTGQICIRDDLDDAYGGISSSCQDFVIPGASFIGGEFDKESSIEVKFPVSGYYPPYSGLPADIDSTFYIAASYAQHSVATGAVTSPSPETEKWTLKQEASPITVSAEKSLSSTESNIKVNLKFTLQKQGNYSISTTDFKRNAVAFSAKLGFYNLDCPELKQGFIDFENTKFISCSALLPRETLTEPLIVTLDYGVKLSKSFKFKIQKGEA